METYKQRRPDDWHLHLRRGLLMIAIIMETIAQFRRAIIMPNTKPTAIRDADEARMYYEEILAAVPKGKKFEPLMTIEITEKTTPSMIRAAYKAGVRAGKIYPRAQTSNSEDGVSEVGYQSQNMFAIFAAMEECGMLLLLHGEIPNYDILGRNREAEFLKILRVIAKSFPKLKIVLEHITTALAVDEVLRLRNVAATITVHHLYITQDDVIGYSEASGGKMQPHLNCRPIAKDPSDLAALRAAVFSGDPKFFYGGDSAPWEKDDKECAKVCAGVFNAPVAMPLLVQLFEEYDHLDKLEDFTSRFGAEWYRLPLNEGTITLVKKDWVVPELYGNVVPFMAGQTLSWKIQRIA